ncbi:hypothetical protein PNEG_03095 [Pneumocystis murina B123]|uniref:Telomere-associated protein Rif1 N-terminal domain-containing protein n=1 Tax=Pneumocystis murina (strain B123) TaxID=1069680 RepID=M7PDS2_PNEMU|nr:hypothetical protein PNEG_03095 [Pneumocystis murina B123]EMR08619.1 hypothetical protein PNEG_03095 [Pneumocystis murina B123]
MFLRSYETIPDKTLLFQYFPELIRSIKRDSVLIKSSDIGGYQMASNAFKVLGYLLSQQEISNIFNCNDAKFFIEHSISVLEDLSLTKTSAALHLWLLSVQKLSSNVITQEIADKIIHVSLKISLPSITITQERLNVLIRIMNQRPQVFINSASEWIPFLHNCLIDTNRVIREKALQCSFDIEKAMRGESKISLAIINNMKKKFQGKMIIDIFCTRFQEIIKEDGDGIFVAHSWSVLVAIIGTSMLSKWNKLNVWLKMIQLCFNHIDVSTKIAAQVAWVRFIHAFTFSPKVQSIPLKKLLLLSQPMQLVLSSKSSTSLLLKKSAIKTVYALLYSTLRPGILMKDITVIWENLILPLYNKMASLNEYGVLSGSKIIASLLDIEKAKPWRDDRLIDNSPVELSEIPRIDPKWVRNNSSIIAPIIETILMSTIVPKEIKLIVWTNFNKSINFATNKEIKISFETMDAVTRICRLLKLFWFSYSGKKLLAKKTEQDSDAHVDLFVELVSISFKTIDYLYFINKLCIIKNDDLIPVQTTDFEDSSTRQDLCTPMVFLFRLFLTPFSCALINKAYIKAISDVININLSWHKNSKKLDILVEFLSVFDYAKDFDLQLQVWKLFVDFIKSFFVEFKQFSHTSSFNYILEGKEVIEYSKSLFKILEWGFRQESCLLESEMLFDLLYREVESTLGITEASCKIIEPLAELLLQISPEINPNVYNISGIIMKRARFPFHDNTSKRMNLHLKTLKVLKKTTSFESLNILISNLLAFSYNHDFNEFVLSFIQGVCAYMKIIPVDEIALSLQCIQGGLSLWISDEKEILKSNQTISDIIKEIWSIILLKLKALGSYESTLLHSLSLLLESGFKSKDDTILFSTLETWNETFAKQTILVYPPEIVKIMKYIYKIFKISLPSFPIPLNNLEEDFATDDLQLDLATVSDLKDSASQELPLNSSLDNGSKIIENMSQEQEKDQDALKKPASLKHHNLPLSFEKTQINKKIKIPFEPSIIMTRRKSLELARVTCQDSFQNTSMDLDSIELESKKSMKLSKDSLYHNYIQEMDSSIQNYSKKKEPSRKSLSTDKYDDLTPLNSFRKTSKKLASIKHNDSLTSAEDFVKNTTLKKNKMIQNKNVKNQIASFKKRKQFSESLDDSSLDDSFSYTKRLRSRSINSHSKIPSIHQQASLKTPNSNRIHTSSVATSMICSKKTDPLVHLDEILPLLENTIPQMTHESLLKLESILFHLQHTVWKTRKKSIAKIV